MKSSMTMLCLLAVCALAAPRHEAYAQGVTTGLLNGVVTDTNKEPVAGANVIAIPVPSGTSYEAKTRADSDTSGARGAFLFVSINAQASTQKSRPRRATSELP